MAFSDIAKPFQNQQGFFNSLFSPQKGKKAAPEPKKKKKGAGKEEYLAGGLASGMGEAVGKGVVGSGAGVFKFIVKRIAVPIMKAVGLGGTARAIDKAINPGRTFMEFLKYRNWYEVGLASDAKKVWRSGGKIINGIETGWKLLGNTPGQVGKFIKNRTIKRPWRSFRITVLKGGLTTAEIAKNIKLWWQGTNLYRIVRFLTNKKVAGTPVSWIPRGWWRKVLDVVNAIKASGIGRWISGVKTAITSSRVFRGLARAASVAGRGWNKIIYGIRWLGTRAGRALGFGVKWFNRGFFVYNVGQMVFQIASGRPLLAVLNPLSGVSLQSPLAFLTNPSFWVMAEAVGSRAVRTMLVRGGTWVVRTALPRVGAWVVTSVIPWVTATAVPAVAAFASSAVSAVSTAVAGMASAVGAMFASAAFATFISVLSTIMVAAAIIGGAIFMVTVAQNRANPPASTKISVSKTMVVAGDSIKATVVLTNISTEKITIESIRDTLDYIPNTPDCLGGKVSVNKSAGFGWFNYNYDEASLINPDGCTPKICNDCNDLGNFPGSNGGLLCKVNRELLPGATKTLEFELVNFRGSVANDSTAKGTYMDNLIVSLATGSIGSIENAYTTVKLDIGGANLCMAKFEAPCGWPVDYPVTDIAITQGCNVGNHTNAVDIGTVSPTTLNGREIVAPISGTLKRFVMTTLTNGSSEQQYGVYATLENSQYSVLFGHLQSTAADVQAWRSCVSVSGEVCPYPGMPVGTPIQVIRGQKTGFFADSTGWSSGPHIHYEIKVIGAGKICPSNYDGGSLLDYSSNICTGVPPL